MWGDVAVGARSGRDEGEERPDDAVKREADEKEGEEDAARPQRSFWKELPLLIGIALLLALLIKTFLVQAFSIPPSRCRTRSRRATGSSSTS
ncbi:hypothetical protein GCM10020254_27340 [Streptomyces goshikiensis]